MPTDAPPSYDTVVAPVMSLTTPVGATINPADDAANQHPVVRPGGDRARTASSVSSNASDSGDLGFDDGMEEDERRSMDDEHRDLPEGWVRCFDVKSKHHFYVDTATKRSIWIHPYDDPEFLRTLPDSHPANPNSVEAQAMRKRGEDEELLMKKAKEIRDATRSSPTKSTDRNWFQKKKDELIGTKEERQKAKADKARIKAEQEQKIREAQVAYQKRRQELIKKQLNDPAFQRMYADDPYGYAAPSSSFSRGGGLYGSPYGYGYSGGYGRRYGYDSYGGYGMGLPLAAGMGLGLGGGMLLGGGLGGFGMGGLGYGGGFGGGGFDGGMGGMGGGFGGGDMGGGMGGGGMGC